MTDWIEHDGGPQPVGDDVWVGIQPHGLCDWWDVETMPAKEVGWSQKFEYRILNQHLIDQLRDELETWQSVFPHVMPDRLKSDQQIAEEDAAAKIDAARLEGIRLGLEAAGATVYRLEVEAVRELEKSNDCHCPAEGRVSALAEATDLIRALDPDTIAKEAAR